MQIKKLSKIEMLGSLFILAKESWLWLSASLFGVGGPMIWYWRQIQYLANQIGWGIYPFAVFLGLAAVIGVWLSILYFQKRIRILGSIDHLIDSERDGIKKKLMMRWYWQVRFRN